MSIQVVELPDVVFLKYKRCKVNLYTINIGMICKLFVVKLLASVDNENRSKNSNGNNSYLIRLC